MRSVLLLVAASMGFAGVLLAEDRIRVTVLCYSTQSSVAASFLKDVNAGSEAVAAMRQLDALINDQKAVFVGSASGICGPTNLLKRKEAQVALKVEAMDFADQMTSVRATVDVKETRIHGSATVPSLAQNGWRILGASSLDLPRAESVVVFIHLGRRQD